MLGSGERERPLRVAFVLVPRFSMIAFSSAVEAMRLANRASGEELYSWKLYTSDGGAVTASNGIVIQPDGPLDETVTCHAVAVCGGLEVHRHNDKQLMS